MKRIAILLPAMRMGGAEKICLNFLDEITKFCDVTLILTIKEGELLASVPDCVRIIEDKLLTFKEIVKKDIKSLSLKYLIKDAIYYLKVKTGNDNEHNYRYLISRTPKLKNHYDCAISYVANISTQVFCLADRVDADKKVAWIHGETTEIKNTMLFSEIYKKFDRIYAVSGVTRDHFIERFSGCSQITDVYYNPIFAESIIIKSNEELKIVFNTNTFNIVTVGRLSPEKGMDLIPGIVKNLVDAGHDICWYIVGDGSEREHIQQLIQKYDVVNKVQLVGNQNNPYPFIKMADLYVQPSYEEGYSTTICEAGILGKPIVGTTTSGGIREQIDDGLNGILAEPNVDDLTKKILLLINDEELRNFYMEKIKLVDFLHKNEIYKLLKFLEE